MSDDHLISKVEILIKQKKYTEAEKILSDLLSKDPSDIQFLALLAEVKFQKKDFDDAISIIDNAIGIAPDSAYLYFIKARIAVQKEEIPEAEQQINQAISLDPLNADYQAYLANIKIWRRQFSEALEVANQALEFDPENLMALNARSTALNKLKRRDESFQTIQGALREDPNNAYTHANYGWGLLEKGDHKKASEHFKEALANDPSMEYAQAGLLEAIKAGNPIYRLFLKYSFWMSNLTAKYQWAVILGFFVGYRVLRSLAESNETLQPYINPLLIGLAVVAFSTWIIPALGNLFLRFNKYGKMLLDEKERMSANFVAGSFALFILGIVLLFVVQDIRVISIAWFGFSMMVPFSTMFSPAKNQNALVYYTVALGLVGIGATVDTLISGEIINPLSIGYFLGFIGFQLFANYMIIK